MFKPLGYAARKITDVTAVANPDIPSEDKQKAQSGNSVTGLARISVTPLRRVEAKPSPPAYRGNREAASSLPRRSPRSWPSSFP
jgi:hypothetical protein